MGDISGSIHVGACIARPKRGNSIMLIIEMIHFPDNRIP